MSLSLKDALIEARSLPFGGVIVFDGKAYSVEELPEGSAIIVPPGGLAPIGLTRTATDDLKPLITDAIRGVLTRAPGKRIKRRGS